MTQKIKEGKSKIYIIRDNNEVVGFTQCTIEPNDIGVIEYLFVLPHCRNNGYGKMLMEQAMEYFNNGKIKHIRVEVVYGNDGAKRFYQQYGFKLQSEVLSLIKM
jgi:ribosomal protein S18 acetylase RimI-like enzyme